MESQASSPEMNEKQKYQPRYMIFIGRHAEPAKKSIFDQVGGEAGIKSDNFEESSLTLKGIIEASALNYDLLSEIFKRFPSGKIKIIFANSGAYRTYETAQIIKEKLLSEAAKSNRQEDLIFENGPDVDSRLNERQTDSSEKALEDISDLIGQAKWEGSKDQGAVLFGITHAKKIEDFLFEVGIDAKEVKTSEFLAITDAGNGNNQVSFRDMSANLSLEEDN